MIIVMLLRPRGLWPSPEHGKGRVPGGANKITPTTAQQNPPRVDFPELMPFRATPSAVSIRSTLECRTAA
jgi:hypothetical protein